MRLLTAFGRLLTPLLYTVVIALLLGAVGYCLLQLIYLVGFLYKIYTYRV